MAEYRGVIIEESLENKEVLKRVNLLSTKVERVTMEHQTPWVKQWTLHNVEIPENQAGELAEEISGALEHEHAWYADFKNDTHHYIIFRDMVFFIDRTSREQYNAARQYGLQLGIPEHQLDFFHEVKARPARSGNNYSTEQLHHFNCAHCHKWWTIGDAVPGRTSWFCPWCGQEQIYG